MAVIDLDEKRTERKMNLSLEDMFAGPWAFTLEGNDGDDGETPKPPRGQDGDA